MTDALLDRRQRLLGPNVPTFYRAPVHIVAGQGVWLTAADGRRYLDAYNNVPHVGHAHPRVTEAVARQAATLDTHSRYLHDGILDYAERLVSRFAPPMAQVLFTCTGSEAMDVALRMAVSVTGRTGLIATDNTYHGNTTAVSQLSTRRPPVGGYPPNIRLVPPPGAESPAGGACGAPLEAFAAHVAEAVADLEAAGHGVAALVLCPVFANEGLPGVQPGWLEGAAAAVRATGGLVIADEVQPGLGRLGSDMWGHGFLGLAPDICVLGKSLGNGYPLAALVTSRAHMAAFRARFGYFNTFAATPVAAAAGNAVLDVMEAERLQQNAMEVGAALLTELQNLDHSALVRVTGHGLMAAVEMRDGDDAPATALAEEVVEQMKDAGVLIGRIGRQMHILKIRPPLPFGRAHVMRTVETLDRALRRAQTVAG
ncbi:MAG: aminotransferase class III-fold pyridoxal phosphate-dependent enzyme [Pseudomonadota bacterium]